jgi:hypothetical protein
MRATSFKRNGQKTAGGSEAMLPSGFWTERWFKVYVPIQILLWMKSIVREQMFY